MESLVFYDFYSLSITGGAALVAEEIVISNLMACFSGVEACMSLFELLVNKLRKDLSLLIGWENIINNQSVAPFIHFLTHEI